MPPSHRPPNHIYVLEYEREGHDDTHFKVGITNDPQRRRRQHESRLAGLRRITSFASARIDPAQAGEAELLLTLKYMAAHGFRRVRGSLYDHPRQEKFPKWVCGAYKLVATMFQRCYYCHGTGHLGSWCPNRGSEAACRARFVESGVPGVDEVGEIGAAVAVVCGGDGGDGGGDGCGGDDGVGEDGHDGGEGEKGRRRLARLRRMLECRMYDDGTALSARGRRRPSSPRYGLRPRRPRA